MVGSLCSHYLMFTLQVLKGCWQLSGGHQGEAVSDRTAGSAAVQDFEAFYDAGM